VADGPGWRLSPKARGDLDAIYDCGAVTWSVDQAERYAAGLSGVFALLARFPELARLRHDVTPPIRLYPYRAHLVAYDAVEHGIEIVRFLHGRLDWRRLLD
jgi:toxin ParE1/3/4